MFEIIQAIILGIVQGLTEFIPVSSSAHLVLTPWLLGWDKPSLLFDTMLHWGTLVSILLVFWRDFWLIAVATIRSLLVRSLADSNARLGWFIVVGTIPAAALGLLFSDFFEELFDSPTAAASFLIVTGLLLIGSEQMVRHLRQPRNLTQLTWLDSIVVGLAQALALAPGISRSGSTIAAGLVRGIRREDAARFSFFLGTPAFFGAGLLQLVKALGEERSALIAQAPLLLIGLVASALSGYMAIRFLLAYLRTRTLYLFAAYCLIVGPLVLVLTQLWR
ncbi:MAG: undecaprenyl-diphosphatase UppP [Caldilineaceae bacterium]|nr:undecaprenyl-diphosphatase UppP [Caldilineaceae bacterium]